MSLIAKVLNNGYEVIEISFEGIGDDMFKTEKRFRDI